MAGLFDCSYWCFSNEEAILDNGTGTKLRENLRLSNSEWTLYVYNGHATGITGSREGKATCCLGGWKIGGP